MAHRGCGLDAPNETDSNSIVLSETGLKYDRSGSTGQGPYLKGALEVFIAHKYNSN
jgi:hypothetical protein